ITSRKKHKKGGLDNYLQVKNDLMRWIAEEKGRRPFFTTMLDLYALPNDFPGFEASLKINDPYQRVEFLEKAFLEDIDYYKLIPYIQLHEFEALLLANPEVLLAEYPGAEAQVEKLKKIVADHNNNPEEVNTGSTTAPSKRIISLIPEYEGNKVSVGATLAGIEGIEVQKERCRHFTDWVRQLQRLASPPPPF
ncbi:MAG: DUF4276 family protein, partial [Bernardetiaceae bacterium]|nr:DUF4276 family protein [Bernardetiaceae bacterium]